MLRLLIFSIALSAILIGSGGLTSCKDTTKPEIIFPDSNVSFTHHVGPLFQQKCAVGTCHAGSEPAKDLNLEYPGSYFALMNFNNPKLILPGDGSHSSLIYSLQGTLPLMPPNGRLNDNQINGVKKWIDEGAIDN